MKALLVGAVALLMGTAAFYFTSGVTIRCTPNASGHASCTESRRVLKLVDIPVRRYPDVRGAASDVRTATDDNGDSYRYTAPVLATPTGSTELAPFGKGAELGDAAERIDAYAKAPNAGGLTVGGQAGGLLFFFHLFSIFFIYLGVATFGGYVTSLFRR